MIYRKIFGPYLLNEAPALSVFPFQPIVPMTIGIWIGTGSGQGLSIISDLSFSPILSTTTRLKN